MTATFYNSADCSGVPADTPTVYPYGCTLNGAGGSSGQMSCGGPTCFHEETQITYKGKTYKMEDFESHSECVIPHVVTHDGLNIATTCVSAGPLRLTPDHLVSTVSGFQPANKLKVGDHIFQGSEEQCTITNIQQETQQRYFGLNCEHSEVLANGYKTSTFGLYHTIPALWMHYASKIVGIKTASMWGDELAKALYSLGRFFL